MSNTFPGQFPLTAPDLAVVQSPGGMIVDIDELATETTSETQNLLQDLTNRIVEVPGSNLDFGTPNTRGIGIMMYLNAKADRVVGLAARIDAEFELDPRVTTSQTAILDGPPDEDGNPTKVISTQFVGVAGVFGLSWSWSQAGVFPLAPTGP